MKLLTQPIFDGYHGTTYVLASLAAILVAALLGVAYGRRLAGQGVTAQTVFQGGFRGWVLLGSFIGSCLVLQVISTRPERFSPELTSQLGLAMWGVIKALVAFMAGMAVPLSGGQARRYPALVAAVALVGVAFVQKTENFLYAPVYPEVKGGRLALDGTILQTTNVTCTPTALANALRRFGVATDERESARVLGTTRFGTTNDALALGVRRFGLHPYFVAARPETLRRANRPAIVTTFIGVYHSVALDGTLPDGRFQIIDPLVGRGKYDDKKLKKLLAKDTAVVISDRPARTVDVEAPAHVVRQVQHMLRREGLRPGTSGDYDEYTEDAVSVFQGRYGLAATGRVDEATWLLLTGPDQAPARR